jgi:hypothetical protein
MDEEFFFLYHLKVSRKEFLQYPINERKYIIAKFIEQREKENEYMEKARK